ELTVLRERLAVGVEDARRARDYGNAPERARAVEAERAVHADRRAEILHAASEAPRLAEGERADGPRRAVAGGEAGRRRRGRAAASVTATSSARTGAGSSHWTGSNGAPPGDAGPAVTPAGAGTVDAIVVAPDGNVLAVGVEVALVEDDVDDGGGGVDELQPT